MFWKIISIVALVIFIIGFNDFSKSLRLILTELKRLKK